MELRHKKCNNTILCKATISNVLVSLATLLTKDCTIDLTVESVFPQNIQMDIENRFWCSSCGEYVEDENILVTCDLTGRFISFDNAVAVKDKKQNLRTVLISKDKVELYIEQMKRRYDNIEFELINPKFVFSGR